MKQKLTLLLSVLLTTMMVQAAPVGKADARQKALRFVAARQAASRAQTGQEPTLDAALDNSYYYIFNVTGRNGFVIVSGDDRTPEILGYSDSGAFDAQNMPENMKAWLAGYEDEMKWLEAKGITANAPKRTVRANIPYLLTSEWGQDEPYKNLCPEYKYGTTTDGSGNEVSLTGRCVTGCVATAMAQVMYYHKWPEATIAGIEGYSLSMRINGIDNTLVVKAVPAGSSISWSKMLPEYSSATEEQKQAVAELMQYCGASVKMQYGPNSSGTSNSYVRDALRNYFDYDAGMRYISRSNYTAEQWDELIYGELAEKRPVLYGGQSSGGGHAFAVDGYEDGYYHINWGWNGSSNDGHFLLSVLNPYNNEGIGASSSRDGYSYSQDAIIGIQKNIGTAEEVKPAVMGTKALDITSETEVTRGDDGYFSAKVSLETYNWSGAENTFYIAVGVYDLSDNLLYKKTLIQEQELDVNVGYNSLSADLSFGKDWSDGVYKIVGISKTSDSGVWSLNSHSDQYFIYATISGNTLTLQKPTVNLTSTAITVEGDLKTGSTQTARATITNNGTFFNDYLYLVVNEGLAGGRIFEIAGGETKDFEIDFQPSSTGSHTVALYSYYNSSTKELSGLIATTTVEIVSNEAQEGDSNVELSFETQLNLSDDNKYILGNKLIGKVIATNNSGTNYKGSCRLWLYKWDGNSGQGTAYTKSLFVPAHSQAEVVFEYDVEMEGKYSVTLDYLKANKYSTVGETIYVFYYAKPAMTTYLADGTTTLKLVEQTLTVPANATAVDLCGQTTVTTVNTESASPNCLYFLDDNAVVPTGLTKNIVKGGVAETILLSDGYDFYSPFDFTANSISYERTFTQGTDGTGNGWTTIILPFDVKSVTADGETIDWFHSEDDTRKNFWVKGFSDDIEGGVFFDFAQQMKANIPYIIAVPGNQWGEKWNLTNKTITFIGTPNSKIQKETSSGRMTGYNYSFVGRTAAKNLDNVYTLNSEGSCFEKNNTTVDAFRAYFIAEKLQFAASNLSVMSLHTVTPTVPTYIDSIARHDQPAAAAIYTLDGRKVSGDWSTLPKGMYIINGKKVIK